LAIINDSIKIEDHLKTSAGKLPFKAIKFVLEKNGIKDFKRIAKVPKKHRPYLTNGYYIRVDIPFKKTS